MNDVYCEDFIKTIRPNDFEYVMGQIKEAHTEEAGWVVGEPIIVSKNADGTITISVPLKKYPVERKFGRSM